jgi:hypothetical protein
LCLSDPESSSSGTPDLHEQDPRSTSTRYVGLQLTSI